MAAKLALVTAVCLTILPLSLNAQVYRWVDENGKVHYSDTKPPDSDNKNVELVEDSALETTNTFESVDDGVDVDQLQRQRERREQQRETEQQQRLEEEAKRFQASNCYSRTEDIRRGTASGGSRVVGTQEVKRCRQPIPDRLKPFLQGYTYEGSD